MSPFPNRVLRRVLRRVFSRLRRSPPEELGVREAYARLADSYLPEAHNPFMQREQAAMLALLPEVAGKSALDLGCGTGRYLKILRARGAARVVGIDLSPEMLRQARGVAPFAPLARGDLRALPIATARFDVVVAGLCVGHLAELSFAIAEMGRVLAPGGTLLYSDFHPHAARDGHARSFTVDGRSFEVEHHLHPPEAHRAACGAAGLEIEEMRDVLSASEPAFPAVLAIRARRRR